MTGIPPWTYHAISSLYSLPFIDLLLKAQLIFRENFPPNSVQLATLLNIKTGNCPENCGYCSQSIHADTDLKTEKLWSTHEIVAKALMAKKQGATRFCMAAAWRGPTNAQLAVVSEAIREVKALGLETCVTLGMLKPEQARELKKVGLDFYNHNLDTSREHYPNITTSHTFDDRIATLHSVIEAGINVCCGGILGMGETLEDRLRLLLSLSELPKPPLSIPINHLTSIPGTRMEASPKVPSLDFVRLIATARIMFPSSFVRLSCGRNEMSPETQALCFFAGANSIHFGSKLLTTPNPEEETDLKFLDSLGITPYTLENNPKLKPIPTEVKTHEG